MLRWISKLFQRSQTPQSFDPVNHLERLLVKAANDPAARPEFLRAFLDSEICVIGFVGDAPPIEESRAVVKAGETISIQQVPFEGRTVTPVFTSRERVAAYAPEATYVQMTARNLLEITGPQELIMNPRSAYGKHFTREEVVRLLDGSAFKPRDTWVAQNEEQILIGRPAKYPTQFVDAVTKMLERRTDVRRAYLALLHIPSRSAAPNLYLALEADGDLAAIAADCGIIAADTLEQGEGVDIGSTSIAPDYFQADVPIYTRQSRS